MVSKSEAACVFETCFECGTAKTLMTVRRSPRLISISSSGLISFDAFPVCSLTRIRPASQSCRATLRRITRRVALRYRSRRTSQMYNQKRTMQISTVRRQFLLSVVYFRFGLFGFFGVLFSLVCTTFCSGFSLLTDVSFRSSAKRSGETIGR